MVFAHSSEHVGHLSSVNDVPISIEAKLFEDIPGTLPFILCLKPFEGELRSVISCDFRGAIELFVFLAQLVVWGSGIRVASDKDLGQVNVFIDLSLDSLSNLAWCLGVGAVFNVAIVILFFTSFRNVNSSGNARLVEFWSSMLSNDECAYKVMEFSVIAYRRVPCDRQRVGGLPWLILCVHDGCAGSNALNWPSSNRWK